MMAILFLPRQFQVAVVENVNEEHLSKAIWPFPLYLLAINSFVMPIALGEALISGIGKVDADTFVLTLPMIQHKEGLALFVFIGGLSAATGMVIVETIAHIYHDIQRSCHARSDTPAVFPVIKTAFEQHPAFNTQRQHELLVLLPQLYLFSFHRRVFYALVSIGLVSFAAVAQFAPSILRGPFLEERDKGRGFMRIARAEYYDIGRPSFTHPLFAFPGVL